MEVIKHLHEPSFNDFISNKILETNNFYEVDFLDFLTGLPEIKNLKGNILDLGANIGNHTSYFAQKGYEVHAFEPIAANYDLLVKNTEGFTNVKTYKVALSNTETTVMMQCYRGNMGASQISDVAGDYTEQVEVKTLDSFEFNTNFLLAKIDVENTEIFLIEGATETLKKTKYVAVENNTQELHVRTFELMKSLGFELKAIYFTGNYNYIYKNERLNKKTISKG